MLVSLEKEVSLADIARQYKLHPETSIYIFEQLLETHDFAERFNPNNYEVDLHNCMLTRKEKVAKRLEGIEPVAEHSLIIAMAQLFLGCTVFPEEYEHYEKLLNDAIDYHYSAQKMLEEVREVGGPDPVDFCYQDPLLKFWRRWGDKAEFPEMLQNYTSWMGLPEYDFSKIRVSACYQFNEGTVAMLVRAAMVLPVYFHLGGANMGRRLLKMRDLYMSSEHDDYSMLATIMLIEQFYQPRDILTTFGIACRYRGRKRMRELDWRMAMLRQAIRSLLDALAFWQAEKIITAELFQAGAELKALMMSFLKNDVPLTAYLVMQEAELVQKVLANESFREYMLESEQSNMPVADVPLLTGDKVERIERLWNSLPRLVMAMAAPPTDLKGVTQGEYAKAAYWQGKYVYDLSGGLLDGGDVLAGDLAGDGNVDKN